MQKRTYQQLQPEERVTIASMKQQGSSVRAMARTLGRSASTVSRELNRNTCPAVGYASAPAQALSTNRREAARRCPKLHPQSVSWRIVLTLLEWKWSPQQISGTLKRMWPNDPTQHVSHETIYTAIYAQPRGELRRQLIACLRHGHSTRMSRKRGTDRRLLAARGVDQLPSRRGDNPGSRILGNPFDRPGGEGGGERFLHRLLGAIKGPARANQAGNDPPRCLAEE